MQTFAAESQPEVGVNFIDRQLQEVEYLIRYISQASNGNRRPAEVDVQKALDGLFTLYHTGAEAVRFRIINQLFDYGDFASLAFEAIGNDPSTLVRHEAAFALGQLDSTVASRILTEIGLNDPSYLVRHEAAMGLVDSSYEPALAALEARLEDENIEVAASCQVALAAIKHRFKTRRLLPQEEVVNMVKEAETRDRFYKPRAGQPPYYLDDVAVVMLDLVDFSARRTVKEMATLVRDLQDSVYTVLNPHYYWDEINPERPNKIIVIPTGDGYAVAFHPVVDRREILKRVDEIHKELCTDKHLKVRFGISRGPHILFVDLNDALNLIGEGIVRAQRAMMLSSPGQILCTFEFAQGIEREIEGRLEKIEGEWQVKEERAFRLYNYRNRKIGNDAAPNEDYRAS